MVPTRRVFVSMPADNWLSDNLNNLKWGIVEEIAKLGYQPEVFHNPKGMPGLASNKAWNARDADEILRQCVGAAVLGMARWEFQDKQNNPVFLATEYNQYEGAVAHTLGLPTLVLVQQEVQRRVVFDLSYKGYAGCIPPGADLGWLHTDEFRVPFRYWKAELDDLRDVFLGYSGKSRATAAALSRYIQSLGGTVLDWQDDFIPGSSILEQIQTASNRCRAGIFLFTKDDDLADQGQQELAVPRDNVVFEAGYFIGVKGKRSVLIIREAGSKMPADLGGDIYASLVNKADISPIERTVRNFLTAL